MRKRRQAYGKGQPSLIGPKGIVSGQLLMLPLGSITAEDRHISPGTAGLAV